MKNNYVFFFEVTIRLTITIAALIALSHIISAFDETEKVMLPSLGKLEFLERK